MKASIKSGDCVFEVDISRAMRDPPMDVIVMRRLHPGGGEQRYALSREEATHLVKVLRAMGVEGFP